MNEIREEIIDSQELEQMLEQVAEYFGISKSEMIEKEISDEDIQNLIVFVPEQLFSLKLKQLDQEIAQLFECLKQNDFAFLIQIFENEWSTLKEGLASNIMMAFPRLDTTDIVGENQVKVSGDLRTFAANVIYCYYHYLFDVHIEISDIYTLMEQNGYTPFEQEEQLLKKEQFEKEEYVLKEKQGRKEKHVLKKKRVLDNRNHSLK